MEIFDLIIIGAGPAGYFAAERAGKAGMNTLLIEKDRIGGVCLNEGCIPSKTLLYSAKIYDSASHGQKYGVTADNIRLNHSDVISRKNKVVKKLVGGIKAKLRESGVNMTEGSALILPRTKDGYAVSAGGNTYTGRRLLLAMGSEPIIPAIPGVREARDKGSVMTNREILDLETVPSELAIIGGGIIGLEMASYYNSAGSKVTVIEMLDHIAGQTDRDISDILKADYENKGIVFELGSKVISVNESGVVFERGGKTFDVPAQKILMSIGRKPVTAGIGLENIGVELEKGAVRTDRQCRTNVPEVYAAGDVNGKMPLAHTAYREALVAINNMLGKRDVVRYETIPSVIYTNPEAAGIGETDSSAKEKGMDYDVIKLPMMFSGRYAAENEGGGGICKIIIDRSTRKILGAHMIGNPVSEIIYGVSLMMENEMRVEDIKELVFPHPTVSEIIREAIFDYK
jgi:dihydrolipoamide dehydrogenase